MTHCRRMYGQHAIPGHAVQYLTTALLINYLSAKYPHAWALNGRTHLLRRIRNLDARNTACLTT